MVADKKYIRQLRKNFYPISSDLDNEILTLYGQEEDQYPMTEQDLWENIRKTIEKNRLKNCYPECY